ncbi:MAG: HPF/RaiA family ribosome-associated protein [Flavobacteriales bacterium]|jgi:ribosomal subunit interface protein|nr:HPF/RaiA family ribosome-associated protein [Flavobacteriales bacterium]MCB0757326.1 HPF/RaiA family ribosome-associated protein [Flavobacteriales bacterium]
MHIQINTDKNIEGTEELAAHVRSVVEKSLEHFAERLTRVEVHLSDENADKSGTHDHTCTMEARPNGMEPFAATHKAANVHLAVDGAAQRLANKLRTRFGRLDDRLGAARLPFEDEKA